MSKDNVVDHLCKKKKNFRNEVEHFDISHSSENLNSIDKLNLSNTHNFKTSSNSSMLTSTNDTSDKEIIGIDVVHNSSQLKLNEKDCRFVIEKIGSNETILNSQDEKLLHTLIEKMNDYTSSTDSELLDLNTQKFMELNLKRALQLLSEFSQKLDLNSSKTHSIKQVDSDNSSANSPILLISDLRNVELKNKNSIINDQHKLNNLSPKIDLKLSSQDQYVECPGEDQDTEITSFRDMCEMFSKIGEVDNNKIMKKNNQSNNNVFKPVNHNVISCSNSTPSVLNTFQLNSFKGANDISKRLALKRHQTKDLRFDSSDDSSSEYLNDLSSKQYNSKSKSNKITFPEDNLKIDSKRYSDTIVDRPKCVKKIKLSDSSGDREVDYMLIENKLLKENHTIFYFSSTGKVHFDMLNSIKKKKSFYINN
ncbi:PREDICTED: uncharacterized protein PF07_0086-like [Diuraphis noxia]|uniref:uncharacterized protein PF07_0086-like n=1 Tax=Diuraphis noxia TaxID=143948 RepID=UPI000763A86C|nr:PREDICTED: uncharacterized protein PF07_0086-like [Diuraphis noxia]XP_015370414.1 PREDICTED: uncharacterized protein PF07_0086-like [Diuraphis noxia]